MNRNPNGKGFESGTCGKRTCTDGEKYHYGHSLAKTDFEVP